MPSKTAIKKVGSTALTAGKKALSLMQPSNLLKIGIGVVGIGVGIYFIRKQLQTSDAEKQVDQLEKETNSSNLSYSLSNYGEWAGQLEAAMFDAGTYEEMIYEIMRKMQNIDDLRQLLVAFGARQYRSFGIPYGDYTLGQWFAEELNSNERSEINEILTSNGINYSF